MTKQPKIEKLEYLGPRNTFNTDAEGDTVMDLNYQIDLVDKINEIIERYNSLLDTKKDD